MPAVGLSPWENDQVADWFCDVMDSTQFPAIIREALKQEPAKFSLPIIRAAASVLIILGEPFIWPPEEYESDFELAANQLTDCLKFVEDTELRSIMDAEIQLLRSRLTSTYQEIVPLQIELLKRWYL